MRVLLLAAGALCCRGERLDASGGVPSRRIWASGGVTVDLEHPPESRVNLHVTAPREPPRRRARAGEAPHALLALPAGEAAAVERVAAADRVLREAERLRLEELVAATGGIVFAVITGGVHHDDRATVVKETWCVLGKHGHH
jgi:hypothetical protein